MHRLFFLPHRHTCIHLLMQEAGKRWSLYGGLQASTLKPVLSCLATVTAAADPREWASAVRPFGLLLGLSLDERPKVRKRAQEGIVDVLAAVQGTPAADLAAASVLRGTCPHHHLLGIAVFLGTAVFLGM